MKQSRKHIFKVNSIIDIGCGIRPQKIIKPKTHICCEPYDEYVNELKKITAAINDREWVILKLFGNEIGKLVPENTIDSVFLLDVIEHIEKEEGRKLLENCLKIARHQVILFTPIGFFPQHHPDGKDAWGLNGADFQEHKSGWEFEDFTNEWVIHACKDFHKSDNLGNPLDKPIGAMFCVYTKANFSKSKDLKLKINYKKQKITMTIQNFISKVYHKLFK